jgi:Txe/YoeB family toxin of Txe-Axe toxin-antitoxin module
MKNPMKFIQEVKQEAFKGLPKKATLYTEDTELFCRVP